ncbi:MAG TPA: hypothetical protein ENI64_03630 [Gammaproteobacteria bacterium]|nr:hypothetical protein [Gammaproteobacteria bacterium]
MRILSITGKIILTALITSFNTALMAAVPTPFVAQDFIAAKVFNLEGHCGPTSTWTYSRTPVGSDMRIDRTHVRQDALGVNCKYFVNSFMSTAIDYSWIQRDQYDNAGAVLVASYIWDRPIPRIILSMVDQNMVGEAASSTLDTGHIVDTTTLLGVESVTVPYGTFTNCLKLHVLRITSIAGDVSRIVWRCPSVGIVKMIQGHTTTGKMQVWELADITLQ